MNKRFPNLFIVGAPKCGTTALYGYLATHPSIYMSPVKEPHYLAKDFSCRGFVSGVDEYLANFVGAQDQKWRGEGSVWYLYSETAANEIKAAAPDARILIMLRNPVEMVYALHSEQVYTGMETITDFEVALGAEDTRRGGPQAKQFWQCLQYRWAGRFSSHVQRYLDAFGPERVQITLYDDFRRDAQACVKRTLDFLEVDSNHVPATPVVNANKVVRSPMLHRLVTQSDPLRQSVGRFIPRSLRSNILAALHRANTKVAARTPLAASTRQRLASDFAEDIGRLEVMLGRNLSHWE